ncbi:MAG: D-amino acid aminotransferase, partial [Burkholderiaceae bacterium]
MEWQDAPCYLNGEWVRLADAKLPVLDRGFIFGDGVYEVVPVDTVDGVRAPFRAREHFERLERSLAKVAIDNPFTVERWLALTQKLIASVPWPRTVIYIQVTRGVAKRDHAFPVGVAPTVFAVAQPWPEIAAAALSDGVSAVTHADERWQHCDIKSVSLLGNVLMKQYAVEHDAAETILLRDGHVSEASASNVLIVKDGVIVAPVKNHLVLPGITLDAVIAIANAHGARLELRPITDAELRAADEVWLSSSGREVMPVTLLDGQPVGRGQPGPVLGRMLEWFAAAKQADAAQWKARAATLRDFDAPEPAPAPEPTAAEGAEPSVMQFPM